MKKFFSAILLIAAMAFSVSTFVSCNDLVEEVEDVTAQAGANAEAIKALQAQLESGLASANAAVEAAKTAAEKAVAEAKKAAIEEALAEAAKLDAENTEAINALKAVVEAINGKVSSLEAADAALALQIDALEKYLEFDGEKSAVVEDLLKKLEDLKKQVEDASILDEVEKQFNEMVKEIDAKIAELKTLTDVIDALLAQIQSVTFVPTSAVSEITQLGAVKLTGWDAEAKRKEVQTNEGVKYVLATYEVRPAEAIEGLKAENLQFVTAETKAVADAEYFDVKIVEKDLATGRMIVLGLLDKNVDKTIYTTPSDYSLALAVCEDFKYGEEAGTCVSSAYVKVGTATNDFEIADNLGWELEDGSLGSYDNKVNVAFNTEYEDSERDLFDVTTDDIKIDFKGTVLTREQVKEFFGIEKFDIKYDALTKAYAKTDKVRSGIKFTAAGGFKYDSKKVNNVNVLTDSSIVASSTDNFSAKAKMVEPTTEKFEKKDAIKDNLVAVMKNFTVNGYRAKSNDGADLIAQSTYTITYAAADITISSPGKVAWDYRYAPVWTEIYDLDDNNEENANAFLATMDELTVSGKVTDITKLKTDSNKGDDVTPAGYLELTGKAFQMNGKPYIKDGETAQYEATIAIKTMGKTIVRLAGSPAGTKGLLFADQDLYWEFTGVAYDEAGTEYTIAFAIEDEQFVTEAIPQFNGAIKEEVTVEGYAKMDMVADVDPIAAAINAHDIYALKTDAEKTKFYSDFLTEANKTVNLVESKLYKLANGEFVDANGAANFNVTFGAFRPATTGQNAKPEDEASTLTIDKDQAVKYGEVYRLVQKINVFGIVYTYEFDITIVPPTAKVLEYDGVNTDSGNVDIKFGGTATAGYKIPTINVNNYYKNSEALQNLIDGKVWNPVTKAYETKFAGEYELVIESANTFIVNSDKIADAPQGTTVTPIIKPIAAVQTNGTVLWIENDYTTVLAPYTSTEVSTYWDNTDAANGKKVWLNRGVEKMYNTQSFTFNVIVRTATPMEWNSTAKTYVKSVVDVLPVTFNLPDMVSFKAGEYEATYADYPTQTATVKATQTVLITDKGATDVTNHNAANVANSLVINNLFEPSVALAGAFVTKVVMDKTFAKAQNGTYWFEASSGLYKPVDDKTPANVDRYNMVYEPVFTYNSNATTPWTATNSYNLVSILTNGSVNGIEFVPFEHTTMTVECAQGTVKLVQGTEATEETYVNPKEASWTPGNNQTAADNPYTYKTPTDFLVTYNVTTGQVTLNNAKLDPNTDMATDIVVTVPVKLDNNFRATPQDVKVKVVFTEEKNEENENAPLWWAIEE